MAEMLKKRPKVLKPAAGAEDEWPEGKPWLYGYEPKKPTPAPTPEPKPYAETPSERALGTARQIRSVREKVKNWIPEWTWNTPKGAPKKRKKKPSAATQAQGLEE